MTHRNYFADTMQRPLLPVAYTIRHFNCNNSSASARNLVRVHVQSAPGSVGECAVHDGVSRGQCERAMLGRSVICAGATRDLRVHGSRQHFLGSESEDRRRGHTAESERHI